MYRSRNHRDTFSTYSPVINFTFFIGAVVFGMVLIHPGFLVCSVVSAVIYYLIVKGRRAVKLLAGLIPVLAAVTLINPLLNTQGSRVLFTYMGGRPYTAEALFYGMALAAMFAAVMLWFSCYNVVMTSDKFIHMFGRMAPSVSLILTMVLKLVPGYRHRLRQISTARRCIGMAGGSDGRTSGRRERMRNGMAEVSALTSWAFESGIVTADSMRGRGYGSGRRTNFSVYRFELRDRIMLSCMAVLMAVTACCCIAGAAEVAYTPELCIKPAGDPVSVAGLISYGIFLMIPAGVNITEEIKWRILRSKI